MSSHTNIGILGIGAIGSVISWHLQALNHNVLYFNRTHKDALKLQINNKVHIVPIHVNTVPQQIENLDWLIICLKAHQFPGAMDWFKHLINSQTKIAVIRNGLNLAEPLLNFADRSSILECMIDCPAQPDHNWVYHQYQSPGLTLPNTKLALSFGRLFEESDCSIKHVEDFKTTCWKKLCEASALGAILCLTGETAWVFKDKKIKELYSELLSECIAVAIADGANIPPDFIEEMLNKLNNYPESKGSSMLTDRLNGRRIELQAKNGIISDIARQHHINTPLNDTFVALLDKVNNRKT